MLPHPSPMLAAGSPGASLNALSVSPQWDFAPSFERNLIGRTAGSTLSVIASSGGSWSIGAGPQLLGLSLVSPGYSVTVREQFNTSVRDTTIGADVYDHLSASASGGSFTSFASIGGGSGGVTFAWGGSAVPNGPTNTSSCVWSTHGTVSCTVTDAVTGESVGTNSVSV